MFDYMEQLAITGKYQNGNAVHLYISDINLNKSGFNLKIFEKHLSVIESLILNGIASTDIEAYLNMKRWFRAKCRLSTMISQCSEARRIAFFNEQRCALDAL